VELFHEPNRRQHKSCQRVEITTMVRGQAVRAEASAADFYGALDCAVNKLENRLRRMHDRRRVHHGARRPASVGQVTSGTMPEVMPIPAEFDARSNGQLVAARIALLEAESEPTPPDAPHIPEQRWDDGIEGDLPGQIVREKEHPGKPMTVDQALYEMELVGHDFYLFADSDSGMPSVVYRRRGFAYGVIKLV
jgi:hypothetical protein